MRIKTIVVASLAALLSGCTPEPSVEDFAKYLKVKEIQSAAQEKKEDPNIKTISVIVTDEDKIKTDSVIYPRVYQAQVVQIIEYYRPPSPYSSDPLDKYASIEWKVQYVPDGAGGWSYVKMIDYEER